MELSFTMLYCIRNVCNFLSNHLIWLLFCNLTWHEHTFCSVATEFGVVHLSLSGNKTVSILCRGQVGGCNGVIYLSCHRNISVWLGSHTHQAAQIEPFIKSQSMWHYWPQSRLSHLPQQRFIIQYVKSTMMQNVREIQLKANRVPV